MRWLVPYLLLLTASVAVVPCARAETVPLRTSDDPVGDAVDTTTGAVDDLSKPVSTGDVGTAVGGAVSTLQQTATDTGGTPSGGSRTSSRDRAGSTASPGKEFRSRFDRLPLRLERLLERIELGRNVRANIARLQEALASLSASERARVIRLLNAEIRRLRANGLSPTERRRVARLLRAREEIVAPAAPTSSPEAVDARTTTRTTAPPLAGGVLGAAAAGYDASPGKAAPPTGGGSSQPSGIVEGGGFPLTIVLALGAVLLVILGGLAVREEWRACAEPLAAGSLWLAVRVCGPTGL